MTTGDRQHLEEMIPTPPPRGDAPLSPLTRTLLDSLTPAGAAAVWLADLPGPVVALAVALVVLQLLVTCTRYLAVWVLEIEQLGHLLVRIWTSWRTARRARAKRKLK